MDHTVGCQAAAARAECPICFDSLCTEAVGLFVDEDNERTCRHFFHYSCMEEHVQYLQTLDEDEGREKICPMCRVPFHSIEKMADPSRSAERWFQLVDVDQSGNLSSEEIKDVVRATCDVSEGDVDKIIDNKFDGWDKDISQGIEWSEFPQVITFIRERMPPKVSTTPPSITANTEGWYDYWDEDLSGKLEKDEVCRALIKAFENGQGIQRIREMRRIVATIWPLFDKDKTDSISREEFLATDSLADTIIAAISTQA
eukprot:TRINITY_DN1284_c1_g1_i3.p1 TRINITY_DN1284_c1_g1~~TRINITY_DN1284_c1_g1_i3.p1  ORF type:complete len:257 (+),score=52.83 TRINITY_DN1284_c1_g1_i3:124-894(+)